jgi:hypothetical protein
MGSVKEVSSYKELWKPCENERDLRGWLETFLRLTFAQSGICPGHVSPFEYLRLAYFEPASDLVVWAPRGGGKTRLGAAATLLDLFHKPGVSVRILGGSLDQSLRMWEHLLPDLMEFARDQLDGKVNSRRMRLINGSSAGVIPQSERAVRGLRIQKLRCDEADMFDRDIWQAAQLVTQTKQIQSDEFPRVTGAIEALSTLHHAGGMMEEIIENAEAHGVPVIRWCLMEVLEKCPAERDCKTCPLHEECGGRAKTQCNGFMSIDDAIRMKQRSSKETWEAEMLCRRPSRKGCVFGNFDMAIHVREALPAAGAVEVEDARLAGLYLGIDFGFHNPFVCLWIWCDRFGRSLVIDEYVQSERQTDGHIEEIKSRRHGLVRKIGCDPAGSARNEQTGLSNVQKLRAAGFKVCHKPSRIVDGLEMIRAGLRSGTGAVTLFIHPRCKQLIQAMRAYRYGEGRDETPKKDGPDHLVDALRYYFVNREGGEVEGRRY